MKTFIKNITQVSPSDLITDENQNLVISELQNNVEYLASLISAPNTLNNVISLNKNLLNYDINGNLISSTAGILNDFEKVNSWLAVEDNVIKNDSLISTTVKNALVYSGKPATIESGANSNSWLERDVLIPDQLSDSYFVFGIKGVGLNTIPQTDSISAGGYTYCNTSTIPGISAVADTSTCITRYEDIIIKVIGSDETVIETKTLGPWPQFLNYSNEYDDPKYRSVYTVFKVNSDITSIKLKIFRTKTDGAIALSNILLLPVSKTEIFDLTNIDINNLYDFQNNCVRKIASSVNGRQFSAEATKENNLITKELLTRLSQYNHPNLSVYADSISGATTTTIYNSSNLTIAPKLDMYTFSPSGDQIIHFNMKTDGPSPGTCCLSFNYMVNGSITCPISSSLENGVIYPIFPCNISGGDCVTEKTNYHSYPNPNNYCNKLKLDIYYKTLNPGEYAVPLLADYTKITYYVAVPNSLTSLNKFGYFEIYGNFFDSIVVPKGAITHFMISRNGSNINDTFTGNLLINNISMSLASPDDDLPAPRTYTLYSVNC